MIPNVPEVSIMRIPLDAAGETVIRQKCGYFHLWGYEDPNGQPVIDGLVTAVFGGQGTADDAIPMSYNTRMQFASTVDMVTLRWAAQPGRRAVVMVGPSGEGMEAMNAPTRQIVFQGQARSFSTQGLSVPTVRTMMVNSNTGRQRLLVQAPSGNPGVVFIGWWDLTPANGIILEPGSSIVLTTQDVIHCMATMAGNTVRIMEDVA